MGLEVCLEEEVKHAHVNDGPPILLLILVVVEEGSCSCCWYWCWHYASPSCIIILIASSIWRFRSSIFIFCVVVVGIGGICICICIRITSVITRGQDASNEAVRQGATRIVRPARHGRMPRNYDVGTAKHGTGGTRTTHVRRRGTRVNFIDTAEMYPVPTKAETQGRTDQYIASWLKSGVVKRDDVVIATKLCGYSPRIDWIRDGGKTPRVDAKNVKESVDESLKRLGIDTIDLLQIHWPHRYVGGLFGVQAYDPANDRLDDDVPFEEQLRALKKVVDEGKVRYIGVSNETSWGVASFQMAAERHKLPKVQTIQNSYSLIVRSSYETDLAEVCAPRNCNVSLLAYSPLAGGSLSGKYCDVDDPATNPLTKNARFSLFPGYMERFQKSRAMEAARKYADLARRYGMTPSELALKFARSRWFVASTIIGATTMDQLRDNLDAFEGDRDLPEELLEEVDAMYRVYRDPAQGV